MIVVTCRDNNPTIEEVKVVFLAAVPPRPWVSVVSTVCVTGNSKAACYRKPSGIDEQLVAQPFHWIDCESIRPAFAIPNGCPVPIHGQNRFPC